MTEKPPSIRRAHIREAIRRLAAKGKPVSVRHVQGELKRWRHVGASFRDIAPELDAWRRDVVERASGRIQQAVDAVLSLGCDVERDAVEAAVNQRSGGMFTVRFVSKNRSTWGGRRKANPKTVPHGVVG
jgi:hypothetical protein